MKRIICGFILALSFLFAVSPVFSQTIWTRPPASGAGNWFTPANWTPPGPPTATDDAEINNGGTAQIGAAGAVAQRLTLGNNNTDSGTVAIGAGGNLAVSLNLTVGEFGQGTFNVTGGGVGQTDELTLGLQNGSMGTVLVDGTGSKLTQGIFATASVVGDFGTGNLTVSNGGFYKYAALFVGNNANGNGTVLIESGGTADTLSFGGAIGNEATAIGVVTVDGTGSMWTSGSLDIGISGTGTLNITGGGNVTSTQGFVGVSPGGIGTVNVSGTLSTWTLSGTLDVGLDGNGTLNITTGGTVTVNGAFARIGEHATSTSSVTVDGLGSTLTLAQDLDVARAGTGTLMIKNRGTVNMTGANRASIGVVADSNGALTVDGAGSTFTSNGGLIVGESGNGTLHITSGGAVSNAFGQIGKSIGSTGAVTVDGTNSTWSLTGDLDVAGDSGAPGGTGLLQIINNGNVATTTTTKIWNGGTVIDDGTLNTAAGGVSVMSGGFLGGIGTVVGTVTSSGIVSPGDSPGTFVIIGGYTQNSDGLLKIEVGGLDAGVNSDLLHLAGGNGLATLDGTLQLIRINNFRPLPGDRVNIINDEAGHTGTFSSVDLVNWGLIKPVPMYDETNDVYIVFELSQTFLSQALTFNQRAVAAELDEVVGDPRADDLIGFVGSEPPGSLPHDYDLIAPEELASIYEIGFSQAVVTNMNLQHRMDDIRAGSTGFCSNGYQAQETGGYSKDSEGKVGIDRSPAPAFVPSPENRWGIFVTGSGDFVNVGDHDSNAHGYDITTGSVVVGVDYRFCDHFAVGIDGSYSGSTADLVDRGRVEVDGGKGGAYATVFGYKILGSMIHIDGAVSGGWNSYDTNRTGLQDLPVRGSTNGSELNAMLAYGGDWHFGCLLIGTWSSLQYTNVNIDGFTETGSLAPLRIEDQNEYSLRGTSGVRLAYDIKAGRAIIRPEVRAAWQHESGDRAYSIDSRLASGAGDVFTVHGPAIGRDSALVDAGISVQLSSRCSIYAYYDGVLGRSNYENNAVSGGVRFGF